MTYTYHDAEFYIRKPWRLSLWGRYNEYYEAHRMNDSGAWFKAYARDHVIHNWSA